MTKKKDDPHQSMQTTNLRNNPFLLFIDPEAQAAAARVTFRFGGTRAAHSPLDIKGIRSSVEYEETTEQVPALAKGNRVSPELQQQIDGFQRAVLLRLSEKINDSALESARTALDAALQNGGMSDYSKRLSRIQALEGSALEREREFFGPARKIRPDKAKPTVYRVINAQGTDAKVRDWLAAPPKPMRPEITTSGKLAQLFDMLTQGNEGATRALSDFTTSYPAASQGRRHSLLKKTSADISLATKKNEREVIFWLRMFAKELEKVVGVSDGMRL